MMKTLIFILFALAMTFNAGARAEPLVACKGADLMAELLRDKPDEFDAIMKEGRAEPNGKGLLWKITKDGTPPSYLFGTMHVTDARLLDLPQAVSSALDGATTVAVENTDVMDPAAIASEMSKLAHLMVFTDGSDLNTHLSKADQDILRQAAEVFQFSYDNLVPLKPWLVATMLALPRCETNRNTAGELFLDKAIVKRAAKNGVKAVGLETVGEQFNAMASLPMASQLVFLTSSARHAAQAEDFLETMIVLYLNRETGAIAAMSNHFGVDSAAAKDAYLAFREGLVDKRNLTMVKRATPILEKGGAFIAVGALHLIGEKGLVELFRAAGYEVSAAW